MKITHNASWPKTMTSKICENYQLNIFVNENGSFYEDIHRNRYHTIEYCLTRQLNDAKIRIKNLQTQIDTINKKKV